MFYADDAGVKDDIWGCLGAGQGSKALKIAPHYKRSGWIGNQAQLPPYQAQ